MNRLAKRMTAVTGTFFGVILAGTVAVADDTGEMNGMPGMTSGRGGHAAAQALVGHGRGVVKNIDPKAGTVTVKHGPIKEFGWSGMTMTFSVKHRSFLTPLKKGDPVAFEVTKDREGHYTITKIRLVH
ncbi:MAG: copper-binding protein [Nitrospirae bacterium]|nr:copper-binding protein [Nitrospirota bacterium]MCL5285193.1 copper-binding protein [Nitrospirota bacterium]